MPSHYVGRALLVGLCGAAAAAIVALLSGDFDDTHARVVGTSLGFSVLAATAGAGDALRREARGGAPAQAVGLVTVVLSFTAFGLLLASLWLGDFDEEWAWRGFGVTGLLALCGSHASVVLRARRPSDGRPLDILVAISIGSATFDTLVGSVAILGVVDDVDEGFVRFVAVLLVVMLLTTALPPVLRRFGGAPAPRPATDAFGHRASRQDLMAELIDMADRLEAAESAVAVHREAAALRELAARARRD